MPFESVHSVINNLTRKTLPKAQSEDLPNDVKSRKYTRATIPFPCPIAGSQEIEHKLCAHIAYRMSIGEASPHEVLGGHIGLLVSFIDAAKELLVESARKDGIILQEIPITLDNYKTKIGWDGFVGEDQNILLSGSTDPLRDSTLDEGLPLIHLGFLCTLLGKQVTTQHKSEWTDKRASAFSSSISKGRKVGFQTLSLDHCGPYYHLMASVHNLRAKIVAMILVISQGQEYETLSSIFNIALIYLRFAEMNHLHLIAEHVCKTAPYLIGHHALAPFAHRIVEAFELVGSYPPWQQPYLHLLIPHSSLLSCSRAVLDPFISVACEIAKEQGQNMANYVGGRTLPKDVLDDVMELHHRVSCALGAERAQKTLEAVVEDAGLVRSYSKIITEHNKMHRDTGMVRSSSLPPAPARSYLVELPEETQPKEPNT